MTTANTTVTKTDSPATDADKPKVKATKLKDLRAMSRTEVVKTLINALEALDLPVVGTINKFKRGLINANHDEKFIKGELTLTDLRLSRGAQMQMAVRHFCALIGDDADSANAVGVQVRGGDGTVLGNVKAGIEVKSGSY